MARHRLGVVLLVPAPWDAEVHGLRRALGDGSLGRLPAHITLVPPVNVRDEDLGGAFDLLHSSATACPPLELRLGPVATFHPINPVAYLAVQGEPTAMADLVGLKDHLRSGPLDRPEDWPFVPHVTVCDDLAPERIAAAVTALADFTAEVRFERVHVLAEQGGRVWIPVADAPLGGPRA